MRRVVIPLLIVVLLGSAGFGVMQYRESVALRGELAEMVAERDGLRKRMAELQKRRNEAPARTETATARERAVSVEGAGEVATVPAATARVASADSRRADRERFNAFMNTPEMQRLVAMQQKGALDSRYAALFRRLNLSPGDLETFKNLLVERQSVAGDAMAAAREQGMGGRGDRDEIRDLVQVAQAEVDQNIRTMLGESVYAEYKNFEATTAQRGVVNQLSQRLSYTAAPLTDAQSYQLTQILAATSPGGGNANRGQEVMTFGGGGGVFTTTSFGGGGTRITDEAVAQAKGVLSTQQLAALQSLQQEQQAAAQLREQMRANRPGGPREKATPGGK